ncbi:MAG: amino acid permease [Gemmatimonadetes bacterium]|nr:amino acid permease [Gemmatimonadota bacterium]
MSTTPAAAPLVRGIGLPQATALNVNNMIGIGPFITLPLMVAGMGGPHALLCWLVGAVVAIADGLVWAELASRLPGSGGTYVFLREAYGPRWGRLMSFLFLWQVCFEGPLSFASGSIGFSNYLGYLIPAVSGWRIKAAALGVAALVTFMLYRRITVIGRMGVLLAAGALVSLLLTTAAGFTLFDPARLLDLPADAFTLDAKFWQGLGDGSRLAIYAYLGYSNVCFLGDEVREPSRTIPRSILLAVGLVALLYVSMNAALLGAMPWREVAASQYVAAVIVERAFGPAVGRLLAGLLLWTAFGSVFAILLAYSRVLYAAARDGQFFSIFARVHPRDHFPSVAVLALGAMAALFTLLPLDAVITSVVVIAALVEYIGQNVGVHLLRKRRPDLPMPFRMWLYPLPSAIALLGWLFVLLTSRAFMLVGLAFLATGVLAFVAHQRARREWPFGD